MFREEQDKNVPTDQKPALDLANSFKKKETSQEFIERLRREDEARLAAFKEKMQRSSNNMQAIRRDKEGEDVGLQLKQFALRAFKFLSSSKQSNQQSQPQLEKQLDITRKIFAIDEQEQHLLKKKQ